MDNPPVVHRRPLDCKTCGITNKYREKLTYYPYGVMCHLGNVFVDMPVAECINCGDELAVTVTAMQDLHRCIALALRRKKVRTEKEATFLRKLDDEEPPRYWTYKRRGQLIDCTLTNPPPKQAEVSL